MVGWQSPGWGGRPWYTPGYRREGLELDDRVEVWVLRFGGSLMEPDTFVAAARLSGVVVIVPGSRFRVWGWVSTPDSQRW